MIYEDVVVHNAGLEIEVQDDWVPAPLDMWRSWTGRRKLWGIEHHGPVYLYGVDKEVTYRGRRVCGCAKCQNDVEPAHRPS